MSRLTYNELKFPVYLNSHIVGPIGGTSLTVCDAINAAQVAKLNVFLGGKKGTGKTQVVRDLFRNRYGEKGIWQEGRADLSVDEIYKAVNLEKLRKGALNTSELTELLDSVNWHFVGVDEINRCPEITQNGLLTMMNGEVVHKSKPVKLGNGFCTGIATGNLGSNGYVGTFKLDDALADRLHLFLNLDYWKPTSDDKAEIDRRTDIDPRVIDAPLRDISDRIMDAHKELKQNRVPAEVTIICRYLESALDYCAKFETAEHSKENLGEGWPVYCTQKECDKKTTLCAQVKAVGERTVKSIKALALGLQYVAKLKNTATVDDPVGAVMMAAKLVLPYSGSISPVYMREDGNFNNPNIAAKNLIDAIKAEIEEQMGIGGNSGPLTDAIAYAKKGKLNLHPYSPEKQEWNFAIPTLQGINGASQYV